MAVNLSKEVSEFIAAFKAGKAMFSTTDDDYRRAKTKLLQAQAANASDPEAQKLNKEAIRARIAASNRSGADIGGVRAAQSRYYDARTEGERQRQRLIDQQSAIPAVDPALIQGAEQFRAPPPQSAIPTEPNQDPNLNYGFSRGGAVPHYSEGGYVEEDDSTDGADTAPEPDIEDDASEGGALEVSSQSRQRGYAPQAAHDAVLDALKRGQKSFGLDGAVAANPRGARDYMSGKGAYTPQEYQAVSRAIDPENKLPIGQRNLKILGAMYEYYLGRGDLEKAQSTAMRLTQFYRIASARFGALAATAAENGNLDAAAKAAAQAFGFIPNGQDLKITKGENGKLSYTVTDDNGRQVSKGIMSAEELVAAASRINFDEMITNAAGQRAQGGQGGGTGGGRRSTRQAPAEKDAEKPYDERVTPYREDLDKYLGEDEVKAGEKKTTPGTSFGAQLKKTNMEHLRPEVERLVDKVTIGYRGSPRVANEFVMKAAFDVDPNNPDSPPQGIQLGKDGTAKYRGETFKLDESAFEILASLRGQAIQAAKADKKKKDETAAGRKKEEERVANFKGQAAGKPTRRETLQAHFQAIPMDVPPTAIAREEETKRGALDIPL